MNLKKWFFTIILAVVMVVAAVFPPLASAQEEAKQFELLFVHDIHSHLNPFTISEDGKNSNVGGLSRMMTVVKEQMEKNPDTLFLDAGDFAMGTVVQSVFETDAAELRVLGALGVEATTFGNHEFDYGPDGLANCLMAAKNSGDTVPSIIVSNIDWEATKAQAESEARNALLSAMEAYGVKEYEIFEKGDVTVAVIGIFGKDALDCAPFSELIFEDPVKAAKETVAEIKAKENADIIICISHSGTWEDASVSEDEILAKNVPELDVIVSGHTHTKLSEPIIHGNTYIVSCGEYGKYLGRISLSQREDGRWDLVKHQLRAISSGIAQDEETQKIIDAYISMVDVNYLGRYGYTRTQVLAENAVEFASAGDLGSRHIELNLGSIIADSYRYAVESLPEWDGVPVDVAVVPAGLVRESYPIGNVTVEDVYNSFSLGIGEDGLAGYPILSVYLTGEELKLFGEIDASLSTLVPYIRLYTSGLEWTYNPNRLILSKSYGARLVTLDGEYKELEDDKLYRVVSDLYSAKLLGSVTDMSFGLIRLEPKDADGNKITDYGQYIVKTENREVKAWEAIARYMESFEDTDGNGVPNVDSRYAKEEGRKIVEDSKKLGDLLKEPSKFFFIIIGAVLVVLILLVMIVVLIVKACKKASKRRIAEKKERLKKKV